VRRRSEEKVVSTSGDLFSSSSLSRGRKSETNASSSSSSSLVPETLREMESDPEFQQTRLKLEKFGQKTLTREESAKRRRALENFGVSESFAKFIEKEGGKALDREAPPSIVQVNIGIYCNQACSHCHVESSPLRKEETMSRETRERVERILEKSEGVTTLDITGGAPELAPEFRNLVRNARKIKGDALKIIDRCNLTVFYEPGQEDLGAFLKEHDVTIVASLPCYSEANTDKQRGRGVFERSIDALKELNALGYGIEGTGRTLDLMYNPGGAFLPPEQSKLEVAYKSELKEAYGIEFSNLFTLTNMPIKRFADFLHREQKIEEYMKLLVDNFNVKAADNVMCRDVVSIKWDGSLYDCDFNQQLDIGFVGAAAPKSVFDVESVQDIVGLKIASDNHCFGCTAGSGSSCGGAIA
jgi:radical SAM/Cys-rich protein